MLPNVGRYIQMPTKCNTRTGGVIPPPFGLLIVSCYARPFRPSEHKPKSEAISIFDILFLIVLTHSFAVIEYLHDEGDDKNTRGQNDYLPRIECPDQQNDR